MSTLASDLLFCECCGNILDLSNAGDKVITCNLCAHSRDVTDYEKMCVVTKSRPSAFGKRRALDHDEEDDTFGGAIIEEKCDKCGNNQMKYFTLQLRSADEGQTVFYTCTKCAYTYSLNS